METLRIVRNCVAAAVGYGVLHDQVTARVCVEYFTIGHPRLFLTQDPTLLGLLWGVLATWWVGLGLGVPLAVAARFGSRPKRAAASLTRPILRLLVLMAGIALLAGGVGWILAHFGIVGLRGRLADAVPVDRHELFIADLWAHSVSYFGGFVGGIALIGSVWRSRRPTGIAELELSD